MEVLHIFAGGEIGGIEKLCQDYVVRSRHNNDFLFYFNGGIIRDELVNSGINTIDLWKKTQSSFQKISDVLKICKAGKYDVVIVHHSAPILRFVATLIKKRCSQVSVINYAHSNARDMCMKKGQKWHKIRKLIMKKSFNKCDLVIAISKSVKESINRIMGVNVDHITVVYNGVDTSKFYEINNNYRDINKIVYVGRLKQEKGIDNIIESMLLMKDNCKLVIVGDGIERKNLETLTIKLGLKDRVEFLGNRRDINKLLNEAGIFVHIPNWEEGFGITIVEAMAAGMVCVCANKGAIPEIIDDKKNGFILKTNSKKELAEKVNYVQDNYHKDIIKKIKENAVLRSKDFSIEKYSQELDQIIEKVGIK